MERKLSTTISGRVSCEVSVAEILTLFEGFGCMTDDVA